MTALARPSFAKACSCFVHRYTLDHKPAWANQPAPNGKFYAPQYHSDREWYDNTLFNGESDLANTHHCYSNNASWPKGQWLENPL